MTIEVRRYQPDLTSDWSTVLSRARNGLFQFSRDFIEYHGDRFVDMSAIAYIDGKAVALMPAAYEETAACVTSHPGLTFGGVILARELRSNDGIAVVDAILDAFREWGAKTCVVKSLPQSFARYPSADVDYAIWRRGFKLVRRDLSSLLPLEGAIPFNSSKLQAVNKARKAGVTLSDAPVAVFYGLLDRVLRMQHGVAPVHSLGELDLLTNTFPNEMLVRAAWLEDRIVAGTLVFNYGHLWHTQYLASSPEGRDVGALDLAIAALITEAREKGATHISFGTSTTEGGLQVNEGLLWQKESYGARALTHDFFEGVL